MDDKRTHVFLDVASGVELVMPTYAQVGYSWSHSMGMEKVSLSELGEIAVPTVRALSTEPLEILLPANEYRFNVPGANLNPWVYIEELERRSDNRSLQRYIITGTPVNAAVYIESVDPTEPDGTGDMKITIRLQEAKTPKVVPAVSSLELGLELNSREAAGNDLMGSTYTVVYGDTMWAIARRFYGDGSLCYRLATYNGIANANIIHPGQVLQIPPKDQLPAAKSTKTSSSKNTTSTAKSTAAKAFDGLISSGTTPTAINKLEKIWLGKQTGSGLTPTAINAMDKRVTGK